MADDKSEHAKISGKRPYATLDLKATEIKVTPIEDRVQTAARSAAAAAAEAASTFSAAEVPRPLPAGFYALKNESRDAAAIAGQSKIRNAEMKSGAEAPREAGPNVYSNANAGRNSEVRVERRGGFFSHAAAGIAGGALALAGMVWLLPRLGIEDFASRSHNDTSALAARLSALENSGRASAASADIDGFEKRVAALEATAGTIPSLVESQRRLVAETKATLASSASDTGSSELIVRLSKVEDKMKALADAGANDPSAGRVQQLAALTGKVSDLETSLGTQLTELRKSVAQDVEGRVQSATQLSEAARAGTQRLDRDVAAIRSEQVRLDESVKAAQENADRLVADLKSERDETGQIKSTLESVKSGAAKPGDITAAVAPLGERVASLEKSMQDVIKAEDARKADGEKVVLALELQKLKRALDSGQSYAEQLEDVKRSANGKLDLGPLVKLQDAGVPSRADLVKDFPATATAAIDADSAVPDDTVIDKLWEGAKSVVRVRRIDAKPDDKSVEATVGRMQVALNDGRLTDVLQESKTLSPKAQDAARPFLDKVAARVSVDTALADLESQLKNSLAPPSPAAKPQH